MTVKVFSGIALLALLGSGFAAAPARAQMTSLPKCVTPYQEVSVTNEVTPTYPIVARQLGLGRITVLVQVSISPTGQVVGAAIYKSSGNADVDAAAVRAAEQSSYQPKLDNCQGQNAQYLFRAEFVPPSISSTSCDTPNHGVKVRQAVLPQLPDSVREAGIGNVQAVIDVKVDAHGNLVSASIAQSSGDKTVDQAILDAAQKTTYMPALANCQPVAGESYFHVGFGAKPSPSPTP